MDTGTAEALTSVESEHMVLDLDTVKEMAERISVSPCLVALDPAGSLVVSVVLGYLLLMVWITVSKTGEVEYVDVDAWFPSTSTTEYDALARITICSLRFRKSRGKEQDCNVNAKMGKTLRKYIRSIKSFKIKDRGDSLWYRG